MSGSASSPDRAQRARQWRRGHRPPTPGLDRGLALIAAVAGLVALAPMAAPALRAALRGAMQPEVGAFEALAAATPALVRAGGIAGAVLVAAVALALVSALLGGRLGPVRPGPGVALGSGARPSAGPGLVIAALAVALILDGVVASAARATDASSSGLAAALGAWALRVASIGGGALLLLGAVQWLQGRWAVDRAALADAAANRGGRDRSG